MKNKKISIIIPVYNVEEYLDQCIQSVVEQTYKNLEIILINDGSTDSSLSICKKWALYDKRIVIINKNNGGLGDARNVGIRASTGDCLSFVDSDDYLDKSCYEQVLNRMLTDNLDIVCFRGKKVFENGKTELCFDNPFVPNNVLGRFVCEKILVDEIGSQVVVGLYKRKCFLNVFFPVGRLYEDIPTTYKLFYNAYLVGFMKECFYFYRIRKKSISNSPNPITPYHIFLGFKDHFDFAQKMNLNVKQKCLSLAGQFAISTVFHYYTWKNELLLGPCSEAESFLIENKNELMRDREMIKTRRFFLIKFYKSKEFFSFMCRMIHFFKKREGTL